MKKVIFMLCIASIVLGSVAGFSWSSGYTISRLYVEGDYLTVSLNAVPNNSPSCVQGNNVMIIRTHSRYNDMYSIALAAFLSGKHVSVTCDSNCTWTNRCTVTNFSILH